jgi:hypothetical protein
VPWKEHASIAEHRGGSRLLQCCSGFSNLLGDYITADAANGYFPDAQPSLQAMQKDWFLFSDEFMARSSEKFLPAVFANERSG